MLPSYAVAGDINAERLPDAVATTNLLQVKLLDAAVALLWACQCHDRQVIKMNVLVSHAASRGTRSSTVTIILLGMGFVGNQRFGGLLTR